jgi:hypothetical protein
MQTNPKRKAFADALVHEFCAGCAIEVLAVHGLSYGTW